VAGLAFRSGRMLLTEDSRMVRGQWSVPLFHVPARERPADVLRREWEDLAGRKATGLEPLGVLRHSVMNRRYRVDVFTLDEETSSPASRGAPARRRRARPPGFPSRVRLLRRRDLPLHPHGGLLLKILGLLRKRATGS
jgi:hypothetical protein